MQAIYVQHSNRWNAAVDIIEHSHKLDSLRHYERTKHQYRYKYTFVFQNLTKMLCNFTLRRVESKLIGRSARDSVTNKPKFCICCIMATVYTCMYLFLAHSLLIV